ncbi:MAG: response regulator [Nitrospirae bacterium]|nr:response regulator [Nitrospirota bacterium]
MLHLEDDAAYRKFVVNLLRREGMAVRFSHAESCEEFVHLLQGERFDLVISDYTLPAFDGLSALSIAKSIRPELPFIFLSGTMGEERAAEAVLNGATDYVLKDRPLRLVSVIRRAIREEGEREVRRSLEAQLLQAQKMECVGRLAGGVAHDFNNLLTVISGRADMLLSGKGELDPDREDLVEIRQAATRAAELTRRLLMFGRADHPRAQSLDPRVLVSDLLKMIRRLIGEDIEVVAELAEDAGWIRVDAAQMEQVLVNLAVNARDAMPRGGKLIIGVRTLDLDEDYASRHLDVLPGRYIELRVEDNGQGIAPEVLPHIFEPFFTTKEPGKGTGLGLSMVYGAVRQWGGHVEVRTSPGGGAAFLIYMPQAAESEFSVLPTEAQTCPRGCETVLLVEDDDMVRTIACRILRAGGYEVIEASNAQEALARIEKSGPRLDLLVTDVVMPGMSGWELVDLVRQNSPKTRALLISGYEAHQMLEKRMSDSYMHFLPKPFSMKTLSEKVREVLDAVE